MCDNNKDHLLKNLKVFVEEQKTWLRNTLYSVGWKFSDLETLIKTDNSNLVSCGINPEHRVPHKNLFQHEDRCEKKNGDYPKIINNPQFEVTIGYAGIVNYFHGLLISFSFNTRRYVKESVRSIEDYDDGSNDNLETIDKTGKNKNEEKNNSSTCLKDLLAAERDAKRRRAAHRGKRVHSNKKSYVEVLREVISSQMETLNDGLNIKTESETIDTECAQKTIIQPQIDSYLGVGSTCYSGNPFKRWINIEEEEQKLIEDVQKSKNEKHSDHNRPFERSHEKYNKFEKSNYSDPSRDRRSYREHFRDDRHDDDVYKSGDYRVYYSSRKNDRKRSYSQYDYDKYSGKKSKNDDFEENHQDDRSPDLREHSERRKKKRKKRSRERFDDDSHSAERHKKKRKKKKSHERSSHKKKPRKSKHHDSGSEQDQSKN